VNVRLLALMVNLLLVTGCIAEIQLARIKPAIENAIRVGRSEEAALAEARMLELADKAHGAQSVDAVRTRVSLAKSYAKWKLLDRALSLARETVDRLDPAAANQAIVPALLGLADIELYAHRWEAAEQTTDRVVQICKTAPAHVPTADDPYDECHFARFEIDDHYLNAGNYEKFADGYLAGDSNDRDLALSKLTVLGRGYARYGAYPEATWYFQRCVDENRPRYERRDAPSPARKVAATASGDVEVYTLDSAHSFHSQSPRCLEDLIRQRLVVGDDDEAAELERWQRQLWSEGPDLEAQLIESMRKSDRTWRDGYNTSRDANNLAFYYAGKRRTRDAIRHYKEAIALVDDHFAKVGVFGDTYPTGLLLDELLGLGAACEEAGLASDALAAYSRALELADRELHPRHWWRLESRAGLARSLVRAGRRDEAESAWREYLETAQPMRGSGHPDFATGLDGLAAAVENDDRREARALRARAERIRADARRQVAAVRDLPLPVALRSTPSPAN